MKAKTLKFIIFAVIGSALILPNLLFGGEDLEKVCNLNNIESECNKLSNSECTALLKKCEKYYQEESERISADINKTAQEKQTLQNKIYSINKKIQNLDYQIYQSNLVIKDLGLQIEDTGGSIVKTSSEIEKKKEQLAAILQTLYEQDQKPLVEILLAEEDISGFFDDLVALEVLNSKNKDLLKDIKQLKTNLIEEKEELEIEKDDYNKAVQIQQLQKQESQQTKQEQQYYLNLTEQEYQWQLQEKREIEKKAAEIKAKLFALAGTPTTDAPTFGEALEIAKTVENTTGVRPAFLLAILQQESAIGRNVGQCYLKNTQTGAGTVAYNGKAVANVMKPTRDVGPFLTITKELGKEWQSTPVSCPMSFGYGGAMGPAQFIPSTWMMYRSRLQSILGRPASPWAIQDSFLASGLLLSDSGASSQTVSGEWSAAMIYFSGSTTNSRWYWYADQVLVKADCIQDFIDTNTMSAVCQSKINLQ